jgi:hypothetical protein
MEDSMRPLKKQAIQLLRQADTARRQILVQDHFALGDGADQDQPMGCSGSVFPNR